MTFLISMLKHLYFIYWWSAHSFPMSDSSCSCLFISYIIKINLFVETYDREPQPSTSADGEDVATQPSSSATQSSRKRRARWILSKGRKLQTEKEKDNSFMSRETTFQLFLTHKQHCYWNCLLKLVLITMKRLKGWLVEGNCRFSYSLVLKTEYLKKMPSALKNFRS